MAKKDKDQTKRKIEIIETEGGEYETIICNVCEKIDYDDLEDAVSIWKKGIFNK
jgi:hypothetical protein